MLVPDVLGRDMFASVATQHVVAVDRLDSGSQYECRAEAHHRQGPSPHPTALSPAIVAVRLDSICTSVASDGVGRRELDYPYKWVQFPGRHVTMADPDYRISFSWVRPELFQGLGVAYCRIRARSLSSTLMSFGLTAPAVFFDFLPALCAACR